jgi:nucleoside 2-deoxyribosyltransferase
MPTCFVMQPFDNGPFDKRYEDVFAPAIKGAGLDPYRVDQDPKVSIPIQDIEAGIRESRICLAEITEDNPNVWFELGYAIACGKEVVLICSAQRKTKFPFDIQHRTIIKYATESPSDFVELQKKITSKIEAYLQKAEVLTNASEISRLTTFEGLDQHEVVALAAITQNLDHLEGYASIYQIKRDMESSGFTAVAATLALKRLVQKKFVTQDSLQDEHGDYYTGFSLTETGWNWVLENKGKFVLEKPKKSSNKNSFDDLDIDSPF